MGYFVLVHHYSSGYIEDSPTKKEFDDFKARQHTFYEYRVDNIKKMSTIWFGVLKQQFSQWMVDQKGVAYRYGNSFYFTDEDTRLLFILTFVGRERA